MLFPATIPLDRLKRVLRAMRADPGLTPAALASGRVSGNGPRLQGLDERGQGGALSLVGGEQGVEGGVLPLQ